MQVLNLDNHWSENLDTWTKGTLEDPMTSDPRVPAKGVGPRAKSGTTLKNRFMNAALA